MNGSSSTDSTTKVFVNHGWDRLRHNFLYFSADKTYQVYNRMQKVEGTLYSGDTYILDEGKIITVYEGVKLQGVPRSILDHLLPSSDFADFGVIPSSP